MLVNLGETLSRIAGGRIKATRHRVIDIGIERFSCPYFSEPKFSAVTNDDILGSPRELCEDLEYDQKLKDQGKYEKELASFGKVVLKKLTGAYGEW